MAKTRYFILKENPHSRWSTREVFAAPDESHKHLATFITGDHALKGMGDPVGTLVRLYAPLSLPPESLKEAEGLSVRDMLGILSQSISINAYRLQAVVEIPAID